MKTLLATLLLTTGHRHGQRADLAMGKVLVLATAMSLFAALASADDNSEFTYEQFRQDKAGFAFSEGAVYGAMRAFSVWPAIECPPISSAMVSAMLRATPPIVGGDRPLEYATMVAMLRLGCKARHR